MKVCSRCIENKPLTDFYSQEKTKSNGDKYTYYQPYCKKCAIEKVIDDRTERYDEFKDEMRDYMNKRRRTDKGRMENRRNANLSRKSGYLKRWQQNNPEKVKEYALYRSMHKQHDISESEWIACKEYFSFKCAYCEINEEEAKKKYNNQLHKDHADHEGSNDLSNCIPACKSCNGKKHNFDLIEWYKNSEDFTQERMDRIGNWLDGDYKQYIH